MTELVAVARLVLAGVFVVSAIAKLRDRSGAREAVVAFGVPTALVGAVAAGLPFAELAAAVLLVLPDPAATTGSVLALVLLAAFTAAIVTNLVRGNRFACHCFGSMSDTAEIGWGTVARNGAFIVLALISLVGAGSQSAVWSVAADLDGDEALLWAGGLLLVGAVVFLGYVVQTLMSKYGEVLLRLENLEVATGLAEAPEAPPFRLPDLDGNETELQEVLDEGRPVMVVFVSPSCAICTELLPELETWQTDADHAIGVLVLTNGPVEANREKLADFPGLRTLLQSDDDLLEPLGIQGTPGAVLIGTDGRLIGPPAHGAEPIRLMHGSMVNSLAGAANAHAGHDHVHQIEERPVSPGDPVPEVASLTTESGEEWATVDALADDPVLLFWRFDCGFCSQIVDQVRDIESDLPLLIVTTSTTEQIRETGLTSPILRDPFADLESWLHVPGTPSAARIRDGALASDVVVGGPEVMALLRSVVQRGSPPGLVRSAISGTADVVSPEAPC